MKRTNDLYLMTPDERKQARAQANLRRRAARRSPREALRAHLSVFYLTVRRRSAAVAVLLLALALAEGVLFAIAMNRAVAGIGSLPPPATFERVMSESGMLIPFLPVFLCLTAILCGLAPAGVHRNDYTIRRLRISEGAYYIWQAVFAAVCYFLLAAVQVLLLFGAGVWYVHAMEVQSPISVSQTAIALTLYGHPFLHSLLPLGDSTRWFSSLFAILGMAVATAHADFGNRHKRARIAAAISLIILAALFPKEMGYRGQDLIIMIPVAVVFSALMIRRWFRKEEP